MAGSRVMKRSASRKTCAGWMPSGKSVGDAGSILCNMQFVTTKSVGRGSLPMALALFLGWLIGIIELDQ
jgi:hypothetical protein